MRFSAPEESNQMNTQTTAPQQPARSSQPEADEQLAYRR